MRGCRLPGSYFRTISELSIKKANAESIFRERKYFTPVLRRFATERHLNYKLETLPKEFLPSGGLLVFRFELVRCPEGKRMLEVEVACELKVAGRVGDAADGAEGGGTKGRRRSGEGDFVPGVQTINLEDEGHLPR